MTTQTERVTSRQVARALDRAIRGTDGFGVERLAGLTGVPRATIHKHCGDETSPTAATLLLYVSAIGSEDPARALALWRDLSVIVGMDARPAPHTVAADSYVSGALQIQAEAGELATAVARATHPASAGGVAVVASEIPAVIAEARDVITAGCSLEAAALGAPTPQRALELETR
jgi:hypothetical protein